jgi:hypothetical protein
MMTVAASSGTTAITVRTDMTGGIIDRFRTMPVARGAVLTGHVGGSVLRTLVTTTVLTGVALLVGFRPVASVADWFAVVGIVVTFAFALAWLSVAFGLVAKTIAGANGRRAARPHQGLLAADPGRFAAAIGEIDRTLAERAEDLVHSRERIAQLRAGDRLFVSAQVADYLDQLRKLGVSQRSGQMERNGRILMQSGSPQQAAVWIADKIDAMRDPEFRGIYLEYDAGFDWSPDDRSY